MIIMMFCCGGAHDATRRRSSKAPALQPLRRTPISTPARSLLNRRSLMLHPKRRLPRAYTVRRRVYGSRRQAAVAEGSCVCWGHHMLEGEGRGAALHLKSLTLNRARTLRQRGASKYRESIPS